jgi:membrane protein YqaA with SNARE-associated domain
MAGSLTSPAESIPIHAAATDGVSVRRWFAFYGLCVLVAGGALAVLLAQEPWSWAEWLDRPEELLHTASPAAKLLAFGIYISLCCTFLPLPANWIVAAVAMRQTAVAPSLWATTALVAAVGALASTLANLNDYHLFTWMLRHHRIGRVRDTRVYRLSARWFARSPLLLLVIFNVLPIPVDVVRMLATTYRYPRLPFAGANFVGRFLRYGVIACATYSLGREGKWAVLALLGLAVLLAAGKLLPAAIRKIRRKAPNAGASELSTVES